MIFKGNHSACVCYEKKKNRTKVIKFEFNKSNEESQSFDNKKTPQAQSSN